MIDPVHNPGMAVEIALGTTDSAQHLGPRLARVLNAELSRLRADLAFASSAGITVHAAGNDAEALRAKQANTLGHLSLALSSGQILKSHVFRHVNSLANERYRESGITDAGFLPVQTNDDDEHQGGTNDNLDQALSNDANSEASTDAESGDESTGADSRERALCTAVRIALEGFKDAACDAGLIAPPMALVLPETPLFDVRCDAVSTQSTHRKRLDPSDDLLVFCLWPTDDLMHSGHLFGFVYRDLESVASVDAVWSVDDTLLDTSDWQTLWQVNIDSVKSQDSDVLCTARHGSHALESTKGLRVKLDANQPEPKTWFWHVINSSASI